jgi:hypothetical protein
MYVHALACTYTQLALSSCIQSAQPRTFSAAQLSTFFTAQLRTFHGFYRTNKMVRLTSTIPHQIPPLKKGSHRELTLREAARLQSLAGLICWHGICPDGLGGVRPQAAGMRPVACGAHGPPPAPMPRSKSSPGSDARHRSPDVILGFAEYARFFPIYICLSFSLFAL